jgi:hypothetical protein
MIILLKVTCFRHDIFGKSAYLTTYCTFRHIGDGIYRLLILVYCVHLEKIAHCMYKFLYDVHVAYLSV